MPLPFHLKGEGKYNIIMIVIVAIILSNRPLYAPTRLELSWLVGKSRRRVMPKPVGRIWPVQEFNDDFFDA